jgi:hypothetical protein
LIHKLKHQLKTSEKETSPQFLDKTLKKIEEEFKVGKNDAKNYPLFDTL